MTIKFRYKQPKENFSRLIQKEVVDENIPFINTSDNFRFSAAVAGFGMLLRESEYKGTLTYNDVIKLAKKSMGSDQNGYREEFILLVERSLILKKVY